MNLMETQEIAPNDARWEKRWPNFSHLELRCRGTGLVIMSPLFLDYIQALRYKVGPLPINSGDRSPEYDRDIGGAGVHPQGVAVDIRISGQRANTLLRTLTVPISICTYEHSEVEADGVTMIATGIGIRQHGNWNSRFIHVDCLPANGDHPRPALWTYQA